MELKPQFADARFGLASAYAQAGQVAQAVAELDALLREQPDWPAVEAHAGLAAGDGGGCGIRDGARAVQLAEDAARRPSARDADVLNSLAAAYAEVGRYADAVAVATRAVEIAGDRKQTALHDALDGAAGTVPRRPAGA